MLLLADIVIAVIYAVTINFEYPAYSVYQFVELVIPAFIILSVVLFSVFFIQRARGKNYLFLDKVFLHNVIAGVLIILATVSFAYEAKQILYKTNCDINLILNNSSRQVEEYECVRERATEQANPMLCNELKNTWNDIIDSCKLEVNFAMVENGNMLGCDYVKSKETDKRYNLGGIREKKIFDICRTQ
jgi:amino acid transporter